MFQITLNYRGFDFREDQNENYLIKSNAPNQYYPLLYFQNNLDLEAEDLDYFGELEIFDTGLNFLTCNPLFLNFEGKNLVAYC